MLRDQRKSMTLHAKSQCALVPLLALNYVLIDTSFLGSFGNDLDPNE